MSGSAAVAILDGGRSRRVLVVAAAATVAVLVVVGLLRRPLDSVTPQGPRAAVPAMSPERAAISRPLGADERSFWAVRTRAGLRQRNADQGLRVTYGRSGPLIRTGRGTVGIGLALVGRGARLDSTRAATPRAGRNRVSYDRGGGVREWYENGPRGLEQGFTVAHAPNADAAGPLTLQIALRGNLRAALTEAGRTVTLSHAGHPVLSYGDLLATDAAGHALRSSLAIGHRAIVIRVDARGALYPLRIDPLVQHSSKLTADDGTATGAGSVYTTNLQGASVSTFSIGSGGALTQQGTGVMSGTDTNSAPYGVAVSPNGKDVYVANSGDATVSTFSVGPGGALTQQGTGVGATTDWDPYGLAVSPNGQDVYVASTGGAVWTFSIGAGGALTQQGTGVTSGTDNAGTYDVAVSPNGQDLYAANSDAGTVSTFSIGAGGALTEQGTGVLSGADTNSVPIALAVSPNGQDLYVANSTAGTVSTFSIGAGGALTQQGTGITSGADTNSEPIGIAVTGPAGLVVNSTADDPNADPTGTTCQDAAGACTLRGAIQAANALGGAQTITFDIPGGGVPVISPASPLPAVTAQVTIDGTSQPGTSAGQPGVELGGSAAGSNADGLALTGGDSTVKGLIVTGFAGTGISLQGAGGDAVTGDWLGTHAGSSGYADVPNGIGIEVDSPNATIGSATAADRNVIADAGDPSGAIQSLGAVKPDSPPPAATLESSFLSFGAGIRIGPGGDDAQVQGNWLGLAPDGSRSGPSTAELGHTAMTSGIQVAPVGGAVSGVSISDNVVTDAVAGIQVAAVSGTATGVNIQSNIVGPDAGGTVADVIGNAIGIEAQGAASGLVIGGSPANGNTVQGNGLGVVVGGVSGATVSGNVIGDNKPLSQLFDSLSSASPNPGPHNVLGIVLADSAYTTVTQNQVLGDVIGLLSASGTNSRANQITDNTFGNTTSGSPPSIKDVKGDQLGSLIGILDLNAPGDTISGNTLELTGLGVIAADGHGVTVEKNTATSNVLGIALFQSAASSIKGNETVANAIGLLFAHFELTPTELKAVGAGDAPVTEADQTAAVSSPASQDGLALVAPEGGAELTAPGIAAATTGQSTSSARSFKRVPHVATPGFAANITGNLIGTDPATQSLGNAIGAWLIGDVTGSFATNTVANNEDGGIWVGPSAEGHFPTIAISRNSIYSNGADAKANGFGLGLGIDLLGDAADGGINFDVTPNHAGGSVSGPDGLQNYPLLTGSPTGSRANIVGILESAASTKYTVELFASPTCSPSGNGEGKQFLESVPVTTDAGGVNVFSATPDFPDGTGVITATATGPDGTSEFSQCLVLPGCDTAAADIAPGPASASANASDGDRRRAIVAGAKKATCSVSAQRRQKELQLKQQIQDLQTLRNDYNADKAAQWYAAQLFGGAAGLFPPMAGVTGPIGTVWGAGALVTEENVAQLETQIATLQKELDSMIAADKKPAGHLASVARASKRAARPAGKLGVIAKPVTIRLVLPRDKQRGIRALEAGLRTQAYLLSLQRAANTTQRRALTATKVRNARAAKKQWLALASYDTQMAGAWRSIGKVQSTFAKLVASAAGKRKLTSKSARKTLAKFAGSLPAFAVTDARRLGELAGLRALARNVKAFNPKLLTGPIGKLLLVQAEVIRVPLTPLVQALTDAAAIARSLA